MENASKALLIAAGVLVGVLLLSLMVTLFVSASSLSKTYDENKNAEAIQQFNANFTKYLGQDLTIHQVVTICNFAEKNGVTIDSEKKGVLDIKDNVDHYNINPLSIKTYSLKIESYSDDGYVKGISFN